jgi:oligosaccharyltransferase complex subunit alpha (ribophorin I)
VLELVEVLPNGASDVYYRDDIGNISTSTFRTSSKGLEFHIIPRFPLFGGWKNNFYTGYNLPLESALYTEKSDSSAFVLNTTFSADIDQIVIDELVVKVILPEGAKDAHVSVPFSVDTQSTDKHYTYLDTTGRTVLVIEKRNVVKEHNQFFQVHYRYSRISMLQEPLLVAGALFAFFVAVMVYVRFEINITKTSKPAVDAKSASAVALFNTHIKKFEKELKELQNAYKIIKEPSIFKQERSNKLSLYINKTLQEAANTAGSIVKTNAALAEKLQDIVNYEQDRLRATLDLQDLEIEFKAGGSKGKGKYDKEREEYQQKLDEAVDGVDTLLAEL